VFYLRRHPVVASVDGEEQQVWRPVLEGVVGGVT